MPGRRERRHRAQAGTTLIELLVSTMIIGLVVVLLVGAFSTGLIDATLSKRNTAVNAASEYELERIAAAAYSSSPGGYSDCFAVDTAATPTPAVSGVCPAGTNLRADITESDLEGQAGIQVWAVRILAYPSLGAAGAAISVYKVDR